MKEYTIIKKPQDFDWDKVPCLVMKEPLYSKEGVLFYAQAQICYDDTALYVRLFSDEKEIRAELNGLLDEVCDDSCMEFFFSPMEGDRRYFNVECNLNGAMYLGLGTDAHTLVRLIPEEPSIKPIGKKAEDGWELTYSIPYEFIRRFFPSFKPESGKSIRANCFKCGNLAKTPHFLCWNPTPVLPYASFHNPDGFGIMHFE